MSTYPETVGNTWECKASRRGSRAVSNAFSLLGHDIMCLTAGPAHTTQTLSWSIIHIGNSPDWWLPGLLMPQLFISRSAEISRVLWLSRSYIHLVHFFCISPIVDYGMTIWRHCNPGIYKMQSKCLIAKHKNTSGVMMLRTCKHRLGIQLSW